MSDRKFDEFDSVMILEVILGAFFGTILRWGAYTLFNSRIAKSVARINNRFTGIFLVCGALLSIAITAFEKAVANSSDFFGFLGTDMISHAVAGGAVAVWVGLPMYQQEIAWHRILRYFYWIAVFPSYIVFTIVFTGLTHSFFLVAALASFYLTDITVFVRERTKV